MRTNKERNENERPIYLFSDLNMDQNKGEEKGKGWADFHQLGDFLLCAQCCESTFSLAQLQQVLTMAAAADYGKF